MIKAKLHVVENGKIVILTEVLFLLFFLIYFYFFFICSEFCHTLK